MLKRTAIISLIVLNMFCFLLADQLTKGSMELNEIYRQITGTPEMVYVYVIMNEHYDSEKLYSEVFQLNRIERREQTINTLKDFSNRTQSNLKDEIERMEKENLVANVYYLWITNIIGMQATAEALEIIENHPDIESIEYDPLVKMIEDTCSPDYEEGNIIKTQDKNYDDSTGLRETGATRKDSDRDYPGNSTREITYNVTKVNAPQVWEQGYTGQDVIVAVLDTGVNYNHNDIRDQMWIHPDYPNHGYNFIEHNLETMDLHSHGTHCAGTVAGNGSSGSQTGVAPGSTIMALKVLSDEGSGNIQISVAAFQFAIQNGADILSCSFGATGSNSVSRRSRRDAMNNVLSAGVIASVSAGNNGEEQNEYPIPANLGTPGDCPSPWLHPDQTLTGGRSAVISIGATNSNDQIASFSSRGPTTWANVVPFNDYAYNPGMGLIKPDVVAPGVYIKSLRHNTNNGYTTMSGTSMSAPAVAGVLALMLSKDTNLPPEKTSQILEQTAHPLSASKSNIFGSGRVDVLAAMDQIKYIEIENFSTSDSNNNIPDYGETISLSLRFKNNGSSNAINVSGTLTSEDDYVTIVDGNAQLGDINSGQSVNINDAFTVIIADNIPHSHQIEFAVHIDPSNDLYNWYDYFSIEVNAPHLSILSPRVYDPQDGGNNNGLIDPGETVTLFLPITNIGGCPTIPVNFTITSGNNLATITGVSDTYFSFIKAGEKLYPSININVSNQAESGTILPFYYTLNTGSYQFSDQISAMVGGSISAQLGDGDTATIPTAASPINIYFRTLRSQTVYTAEELQQAGAPGSIPLTQFGYYVATAPTYQLPNFIVRMKHTQATDASQHDNGPFTTVYGPTNYSPTANNWDLINLTTPFIWNGVDNILVDTAFAPTSGWDSSGQVRYYDVENGFRFTRHDTSDQTNAPTADITNEKPQAMLVFELAEGADPYAPTGLVAQLEDNLVHLEWIAPGEDRNSEGEKANRKRYESEERGTNRDNYRNPLGYNVYRNGVKINNSLVENTFFEDSDLISSASYYYYVTACYAGFESSASLIVVIKGIITPQYDPPAGIKSNPFMLTISSLTPDTEIHYTLDGEDPSFDSPLYENPIEITNHIEVRAIAYKEGLLPSTISIADYYFLNQPQNLSINAAINFAYLSWDEPQIPDDQRTGNNRFKRKDVSGYEKSSSHNRSLLGYNLYRADNTDNLVKINTYLITETQYFDSDLQAGIYKYATSALYDEGESEKCEAVLAYVGIVAPPVCTPEEGEYLPPIEVTIACITDNAVIRYTANGSAPNTSSPVYSGEPIVIEEDMIIKTFATRSGWQNSEVTTASYTIDTSDVEEDENSLLPYTTKLFKAYPNPFNPQTTINFSLKEADNVRLEIYNIAGQLIKTIVEENLPSGNHSYVWLGTNNKGKHVGNGIYLYRFITSNYDKVDKIVLLK